ncbi:SPOR domain-containing protein [Thermodesulfobacteriota bacterium]
MTKKKPRKKQAGYYFRFGRFQFVIFLIGTSVILVLTFFIGFMAGRITSLGADNPAVALAQKDKREVPLSFYNILKSDKSGDRVEAAPKVKKPKAGASAGHGTKKRKESKASGGPYMIQVAACKEKSRAEALVDDLRSSGYRADVYGEEKKDGWFRVRVGGFSKIGRAKDVAEEITRKEGLDVFVVKVGDSDR